MATQYIDKFGDTAKITQHENGTFKLSIKIKLYDQTVQKTKTFSSITGEKKELRKWANRWSTVTD